jgi:hypothetical protein
MNNWQNNWLPDCDLKQLEYKPRMLLDIHPYMLYSLVHTALSTFLVKHHLAYVSYITYFGRMGHRQMYI